MADRAFPDATPPLDRSVAWLAHSPWVVPLLLLAGGAGRVLWAWPINGLRPYTSELHQVAATLATTGTIANAYRIDGIPTTHVGPLAALPGAIAYRLFGVDTPAAELVLLAFVIAVIGLTLVVLDRAFALLDEPPLARRLAIAVFAAVPVYLEIEARDFRVREGATAAFLLACILYQVLRLDRAAVVRWRSVAALAALAALLFIVSPSAAVPAYAACGVLTWRRFPVAKWPVVAAIAAVVLVAFSAPWALRNERLLGERVWSRGNVGIELALGTHAGAVAPADPRAAFNARIFAIHPYKTDTAYARMRAAGGEVAYARAMAAETWAWVEGNRPAAARIWLRHAGEFYLPPRWLWNAYGEPIRAGDVRHVVTIVVTLAAFAALAAFLWRQRWRYLYPLAMIAAAGIPYIVAQPRIRYRYTIAALLVFVAAAGVVRLVAWLRHRVGEPRVIDAAVLPAHGRGASDVVGNR